MPNLIDRMKSEQSSRPNGNGLQPKNETLSVTTPKSNQLSKQIDLIQKQSEALQKISAERDLLLKEGRPRDREQIQKLSSEILMLRNTVQQKSEMIVQLNARIEKLNASDLQLKNAEEKELRNTKKEKYLEELALDVEHRKHQLSSEQEILQADRAAVKMQEEKNRQTEKDLLSLIEETASELSADARDKAQRVYISKYKLVKGFYLGVLLYGILFTALTAFSQIRFRTDFTDFFAAIWEFISWVFSFAAQSASEAYNLARGIDQPVVASILSVIFAAVVFLFITGLIYGSTGYILYRIGTLYYEYFWDNVSLSAWLITLAFFVIFSDKLAFIRWNHLAVTLLIHAVYMLIRTIINKAVKRDINTY